MYDWARYFWEKYVDYLDADKRTKTRISKQTRGQILLGEGKFHKGIIVVESIEIQNPYDFIEKNILLLQLIYEAHKEDAFDPISEIEEKFRPTMNRHLRNKKINKSAHNRRMNFLKVLNMIAYYRQNKFSKDEILYTLESLKLEIVQYSWLKEKAEELPIKKSKY